MKLRIEAEPGEVARKGAELVKAVERIVGGERLVGRTCAGCTLYRAPEQRCAIHGDLTVEPDMVCRYHVASALDVEQSGLSRHGAPVGDPLTKSELGADPEYLVLNEITERTGAAADRIVAL